MAQAGEFEELARACQGELFALALSRCPDRESAKDVLQEVLLSAWQNRQKLLALPGEQRRRYLFAMARNRAIDQLRRCHRERPFVGNLSDAPEPASAAPAPLDDRLESLDQCMARLVPDDRELLLLWSMAGLDSHAIADRLGSNSSTIRSRLSRIRRQLRTCIASKIERANRVG